MKHDQCEADTRHLKNCWQETSDKSLLHNHQGDPASLPFSFMKQLLTPFL